MLYEDGSRAITSRYTKSPLCIALLDKSLLRKSSDELFERSGDEALGGVFL
jgi:hypothetical protein